MNNLLLYMLPGLTPYYHYHFEACETNGFILFM